MTGLAILDVAIGLIFVFLLLSLFATIVNEWIAQWTSLRAKTLKRGVVELLGDKRWTKILEATEAKALLESTEGKALAESLRKVHSFADDFYKHPLIESLRKGTSEPSYIASGTFARTVIDLLRTRAAAAGVRISETDDLVAGFSRMTADARGALSTLEAGKKIDPKLAEDIKGLLDGTALTRVVETLTVDTLATVDDLQKRLAAWFDEGMERVAGWYKRYLQYVGFGIGLLVATAFNADAINMASVLAREPAMRTALVESAASAAKDCKTAADCKAIDVVKSLQNKDRLLPFGWYAEYQPSRDLGAALLWLAGLLITALATTLGAPFWFDLLKKLVNIRTSGLVPEAQRNR